MKTLVLYFSATGITKKVAEDFAKENNFEILEIIPEKIYSKADINWVNPISRCNKEKIGNKDVPNITKVANWEDFDTIYLGFPIWYYGAPNIINTFCKEYDWNNKVVHAFATSGGSPIGKTTQKLLPYLKNVKSLDAVLVKNASEIKI